MSNVTSKRKPNLEPDMRQRILEVAAELFAKQGYAGTSVRHIAAELGIANPSLYYHFKSKEEMLAELLSEPLERVERAIEEAQKLSGDARTRRIIGGLLEALEVRSGIALTAFHKAEGVPDTHRELARAMRPLIKSMIAEGTAEDDRDLRVAMAIAAVEGAVADLMLNSGDAAAFIERLRAHRGAITNLVLKLLR